MKIFGFTVRPTNPSPIQPLEALRFPVMRVNVGGPVPDPKRVQAVSLYDRNLPVPSLSELFYTDPKNQ